MIRLAYCALLLSLAACPKKGTGTTQQAAGAGCPSAQGVYVATFVSQQASFSGWALPLHATALAEGAQGVDFQNIDAATARTAGVPAAPTGSLWLVTSTGAPCQAKLGSFYAAKVDGPPASMSYGVLLDGCPAPKNPDEAGGIVMVSEQAPTGCRFEVPQPIAGRLGETDKQKQWQRPTKESPLPEPLAAALPQQECTAPACEKLWAFAEVKVGAQTVAWTGAINYLQVGAPDKQCEWPVQRESGSWIPGIPSGSAAIKITEGQDHALPLIAVLADGAGAKVALAEANGQYATYDLAPGKATLGNRVVWMLAPPEAWEQVDHLGPICEQR